eukprot:CAMPEP_0174929962 /NCGR_PEP_ID=MMETSP1355-20121228/29652_1 /TAXON_ID=464990 /ORGANISM="Hemiselmis tepida, Strain CCMP443" /LENGTH=67 /DNA_ID=CAMNT_0016176217 /DNA_START=80 /DNA_END=283 /DNA_ORIENTATION=+
MDADRKSVGARPARASAPWPNRRRDAAPASSAFPKFPDEPLRRCSSHSAPPPTAAAQGAPHARDCGP